MAATFRPLPFFTRYFIKNQVISARLSSLPDRRGSGIGPRETRFLASPFPVGRPRETETASGWRSWDRPQPACPPFGTRERMDSRWRGVEAPGKAMPAAATPAAHKQELRAADQIAWRAQAPDRSAHRPRDI